MRHVSSQTGERISVAVKTCKECAPDVKEKFMSEAGDNFFFIRKGWGSV